MLIAFIIGTRPEAIKQAPVILEARRREAKGSRVESLVISTGQHREMLVPILDLFGITPDVDLGLMQPNQTLADLTARALTNLEELLQDTRPDVVVVQGDTSTAMAGALAAYYLKIPVAHVEAGLRTGDPYAPFPEEINRRIIGQIARFHFAPTPGAAEALAAEQLPAPNHARAHVLVTGNTVIDALLEAEARLEENPLDHPDLREVQEWKRAGTERKFVLVTGHRRENFGDPFGQFCMGLRDIADRRPDALVLYPMHLNPNVRQPVTELLSGRQNIHLTEPADYPLFVSLMREADLVITDSGGVQEEAPALGVPVLVTRERTERPEAVEAGAVELVGPNRARILDAALRFLDAETMERKRIFPYGDGRAAERCLDALMGIEGTPFKPAG